MLREGVLQQVGAPRELYEHPANLFVAGFIGSPPMNFLPATVRGDRLQLPFLECPLRSEIAAQVDDEQILIAGVRPEYVEDATLVDEPKRDRGVTFEVGVIPYEAPPDIAERLAELEWELDSEQTSRVPDGEKSTCGWTRPGS